ncbi:MAG: adenylate/guanylate cyclase domain-containing protein [Spirochaetales bacterium]
MAEYRDDLAELETVELVPDTATDPTDPDFIKTQLRKKIEEYYIPAQLVSAIEDIGEFPEKSQVALVGVAFLDIADYTYLSQFLSPQENQDVLNGLYTAFAGVLKRHGGYLNKIEGDSLMFHYGGIIDQRVRNMQESEAERYIARELFYSCVEMQRVCSRFNAANEKFLVEGASGESREALRKAFAIISTLRESELAKSMQAVFQIRVRIGANIGRVTIGNFGPDGGKQWDIIGTPVIDAKRMESTAPIGGLRISEQLYNTLVETRIADEYFTRFRREAEILRSYYRNISREELFRFSEVLLKDKRGATFRTYSVQVTPNLPESVSEQVSSLINMGEAGANRVIALLKYYRGNPYVMNAVEDTLRNNRVHIRKHFILETMYPLQFKAIHKQFDDNIEAITQHVDQHFSLFELLDRLGRFQDIVKQPDEWESERTAFTRYEEYMSLTERDIKGRYHQSRKQMIQRAYFYNVVFPLVFESIRCSILEYQSTPQELEAVSGA